ncbi:MAG: acyltransferase [Gammaproteobacteria bacterium RIFCSPHIGHO2_12_FULL_36_30]|nr:MAG: acyltransferase [Gammaproteobacteria bacterium RIFCSPHIGHO2_12_FULL_36_30]
MATVAAIQLCSSDNVDENLKTVAGLIQKAALRGAKLIVLPEMFAVMTNKKTDLLNIKEKHGIGKIQDALSQFASQNQAWIVAGTIPIECDDKNKIRAACMVYNDRGEIVARYDKMHLFDAVISETESYKESDTTEAGNKVIVIDSPFGKLGLAVCYDIRFPALFTALQNKGAEIITIPTAFTVKTGEAHWQLLMRARAVETFSYMIGACQGGAHANGRKTYGHSMIIEPWGTVVAEITQPGNGIIYADIDLKKLHHIRKIMPVHTHQKITLNAS